MRPHSTDLTEDHGIPAFLERKAKPETTEQTVEQATAEQKLASGKPDPVEKAKRRNRDKLAAAVAKAKPEKPAKEAKAKPEKPAKEAKAKPEQKPAKVAATSDNPRRSIVPERFKAQYAPHNDTCGTKLALALKAATTTKNTDGRECLDVAALWAIAKENGVDVARYLDLNNGQKRMNVGNKLAGMLKQGKRVVIGKQTFANAEKALARPAGTEPMPAQIAA